MSTFLRELHTEQKKCRHKKIWLIPFGFFLFQTMWLFWLLSHAKAEELTTGYLMLFYQLPVMNTILFPIMIAVIASRLCDMEIKGDTLKLLYTMQTPDRFFHCKYLNGIKYLFLFTLGHILLITVCGNLFHFGNPMKMGMLLSYLAVTLCTSAVILVIQQTLSLISDNQIMPLVVGLAGAFLGLFSLFFPAPFCRLVLWGYFAAFPNVAMDWNRTTRIERFYEVPFSTLGFLLFFVFGILVYVTCKKIFTKKEV